MIARIWHGWTTPENADAYENLLRSEVLPAISRRIAGARGAYVLRSTQEDEVEFVTITFWETLDDVRAFAGDDYEAAVVPPPARALLSRFDRRSTHYETVLEPGSLL